MSKDEVLDELRAFLSKYVQTLGRIYGPPLPELLKGLLKIDRAPLMDVISEMYDYGVRGQHLEERKLGEGHVLDDRFAEAELIVETMSSADQLLVKDAVPTPTKALRVARTAAARHVLEGGTRPSLRDDEVPPTGFLTIGDIALLANMDEKSVRNAASRGGPDRLETATFHKRTLVATPQARQWLAGRRGFVATTYSHFEQMNFNLPLPPQLSPQLMRSLVAFSADRGTTPDNIVRALLQGGGRRTHHVKRKKQ